MKEPNRAAVILIVDDNPGDIGLAREALEEGELSSSLHIARDGIDALAFLRREEPYTDAPRPDLIVLDFNMPRMSGIEALAIIKSDPALLRIPVVVLTTSQAEQDLAEIYDRHANCCIVKPVDVDQYIDAIRSLENFWLTVARLAP